MNCQDFNKQLNRYIDGELSAAMRLKGERHLAECDACSREVAEMRRLAVLSHNVLDEASAPAGFDRAVLQAIAARQTESPVHRKHIVKPPHQRFSLFGFFEDVARAFGIIGEWFRWRF